METSRAHRKQKLTLIKQRRLARHTTRPSALVPRTRRTQLSIIGFGLLAGLGVPALVLATQQQSSEPDKKAATQSSATNVTIDSSTSPSKAEVLLTPNEVTLNVDAPSSGTPSDTAVTINGQPTPLVNGSVSKHYTSDDGSTVDINVYIDSTSTSTSDSSTNISIDSSSFSTGSSQDTTRGSPRR